VFPAARRLSASSFIGDFLRGPLDPSTPARNDRAAQQHTNARSILIATSSTFLTERDFFPLTRAHLYERVPKVEPEYACDSGRIDFRFGTRSTLGASRDIACWCSCWRRWQLAIDQKPCRGSSLHHRLSPTKHQTRRDLVPPSHRRNALAGLLCFVQQSTLLHGTVTSTTSFQAFPWFSEAIQTSLPLPKGARSSTCRRRCKCDRSGGGRRRFSAKTGSSSAMKIPSMFYGRASQTMSRARKAARSCNTSSR
jgi:hypothetical protein